MNNAALSYQTLWVPQHDAPLEMLQNGMVVVTPAWDSSGGKEDFCSALQQSQQLCRELHKLQGRVAAGSDFCYSKAKC